MSQIIEGIRNEDLAGLFGKFIQNIPSMMHDSVGNVAEYLGAEELAASRRKDAAEKRVEGAPDLSLEDLKKISELVSIGQRISPQGAIQSALPTAVDAAESVRKVPESIHYSVANVAKALGAEELAGERMKDAERLKARRLGKDATTEEVIEQRMADLEADRAAKTKVSDEPAIRKKDARFLDRLDERVLEDLLTEPVEDSDYDPTKNEMYGSGPDDTPPKAEAMSPAATAATEAALGAVEEATAEPEVDYTQQAVDLFMTTHGTEFDPKSSKDRGKLEDMKALLSKRGGLKDPKNKGEQTRFALDYYKTL